MSERARPSISVIIPAFNVQAYIQATLDCLLAQTCPAHEVLVFDDGSTDATQQLAAAYEGMAGITVLAQANQGLGKTRNLGAEQASGDYIYFLDADDLIPADFIAKMQRIIRQQDCPDLILFSGDQFNDDPHQLCLAESDKYHRKVIEGLYGARQALVALSHANWLIPNAGLYLVRQAFWQQQGFTFPTTLHEDESLIVGLIVEARRIFLTDDVLFYRRNRPDSIMTSIRGLKHMAGLEDNLGQAVRDIKRVPRTAQSCRKILRRRCRDTALRYAALAHQLGRRPRHSLLLQAVAATGNWRLFKKLYLS